VTPDPEQFPGFDADLKRAMRRETELLFDAVMREDLAYPEFLTADFTFVNQRLASITASTGCRATRFSRWGCPPTSGSGC
jgi:hypothetical protein